MARELGRRSRIAAWISLWVALAGPAVAGEFLAAKPIWPRGREAEKNLTVGFRAVFESPTHTPVIVRLAGSTRYRVSLNGEHAGYGPARGPHGFFRVDEIDVTSRLRPGRNLLAVEVAGYNVNSYDVIDQPSFLEAEVVSGSTVLAATGDAARPFDARVLGERVQKVQRYSFQRPFTEVYRLAPDHDRWRRDPDATPGAVACDVLPPREHLARGVAYCDFPLRRPVRVVSEGGVRIGDPPANPWKDRSLTEIGPALRGYPEAELATVPSLELQRIVDVDRRSARVTESGDGPLDLKAASFRILDLGVNATGFLRARLSCERRARLFFTFDEILTNDGDVDFKRLGCVNIIACDLEPGTHEFEAFEPYTLRYLKLIAPEGGCRVEDLALREYAAPSTALARFEAGDERLNRLFRAGVETFRQNAVDLFMDCPSRERAGWLCDSYFTARSAFDLQGDTRVEANVFENFLRPKGFAHLPEGMLPMCYPADHDDGVFIPNWSLWFVVQLEEYLHRSGDRRTVEALGPRLDRLMDYFRRFRNSDGLLEKLESWVFVEWSAANQFVQDVNYPSNMLYAAALASMGRMYGRPELTRQAEAIREVVRAQSFDGTFFVDNAVRGKEGKLAPTRNRSEVCQYFAFYFDVATPASHPGLWRTLVAEFGPRRKGTRAFSDVYPANAFVGDTLRLELLSRAGLCRQLLDESLAYQLKMADLTGTLWENDSPTASCDHGFASHGGVHVLFRDVLGLADIDPAARAVRIRFADLPLDRCDGSRPVPGGVVSLRWRKDGGELSYRATVPPGWTTSVTNLSGLRAVEEAR
jgi:alpha-L-rhamnosidase